MKEQKLQVSCCLEFIINRREGLDVDLSNKDKFNDLVKDIRYAISSYFVGENNVLKGYCSDVRVEGNIEIKEYNEFVNSESLDMNNPNE